MIYLENFRFPSFEEEDDFLARDYAATYDAPENVYPFRVLSYKGLHSMVF